MALLDGREQRCFRFFEASYNALRARPQDKLDETGNRYRLVPCAAESIQCAMFEEQLGILMNLLFEYV